MPRLQTLAEMVSRLGTSGWFYPIMTERVHVPGAVWDGQTAVLFVAAFTEEPPDGVWYAWADPDSVSMEDPVLLARSEGYPDAPWRVVDPADRPWADEWLQFNGGQVACGMKRAANFRTQTSWGKPVQQDLITV